MTSELRPKGADARGKPIIRSKDEQERRQADRLAWLSSRGGAGEKERSRSPERERSRDRDKDGGEKDKSKSRKGHKRHKHRRRSSPSDSRSRSRDRRRRVPPCLPVPDFTAALLTCRRADPGRPGGTGTGEGTPPLLSSSSLITPDAHALHRSRSRSGDRFGYNPRRRKGTRRVAVPCCKLRALFSHSCPQCRQLRRPRQRGARAARLQAPEPCIPGSAFPAAPGGAVCRRTAQGC